MVLCAIGLISPAIGQTAQPDAVPAAAPVSAEAGPQTPQAPTRSYVFKAHDPDSIEHFETNFARVRTMVDRVVMATTGKDSTAAAWRSLVDPKDIVGIKISAVGGASGATHHAVVTAIVDGLEAAGVPRANVLVWDRDAEDLRDAGYLHRDERTSAIDCPVAAIEPRYGYDPKAVYRSVALGKLIWGDLMFVGNPVPADLGLHSDLSVDPLQSHSHAAGSPSAEPSPIKSGPGKDPNLSNLSHYCSILSRRVTKIVNVPVYADSYFAGIAGSLYNITIPNLDNWRRLVGSPRFGVPDIADIYSEPQVGGRVVINIADGLIAQIAGAPSFDPLYTRHHATIYASRDAVALDATLLRQMEIWRSQTQLPPLGKMAEHVQSASDAGLGNAGADKIEVRSVN